MLTNFDAKSEVERIAAFISRQVEEAHAEGVVVGLSGGVDSSLVATLSVKALGPGHVLGLILPTNFTPREDISDARELAEWLGVRHVEIDIQRPGEAIGASLRGACLSTDARTPNANLWARLRMLLLYYAANASNRLVAGTSDRSEMLIGFFTKYGDGGVDIEPIAHLYKTQVRILAEHLNVAGRITSKPSSPQLYPGHRLSDELPIGYEALDPILSALYDEGLDPKTVSQMTGVDINLIRDVEKRHRQTEHKRRLPPSLCKEND